MASSFDKTIAQEQAKVTGATSKQAQLVEAAKVKRELLGRISQANAMHAAQEKEQQFADLSSLSGRLGLDPEGVPHQILNLGASAVSGAATLAAGAVALPTNIAAIGMDLLLTDEERQAMARRLRGEELATDAAILDKRGQTGYTAAEIYSQSKDQRDAGETIAQFGDISSIVHKGKQNEVNAELSKVWDEHGAEVSKGWENIKSGEVLTGLKQLVPSGASLLMEGMTKFADNPEAASEYIAQNLPQLIGGAMTGGSLFLANTTAGYAIDTYNKGVLEYEKTHDGAAPPADVRNTMLGQAALIMLSEYYGAQSVAKGISRIPGVKEGVAATVGKAGIIPAAARTTGAVAGGYVNEGFTEGVQTYLEGEIKGKPASGEDIFKSVTIGGLVGSAISGGASTATEALTGGDSNNTLDPVKRDKDPAVMAAVAKAREAGDLASLTDTSNIAYSPTTAVDLLYAITQDSTKTPEEKADAIKKSADVVATLEENVADAKANLERFSPEGLKLSSERKARGIERLAALDPNDPDIEAKTEQLKNALSTVEKDLTANPKQKKAEYAKELKYYEATLSKAQELLSQTNTLSDSENTALAPEIAAVQTAAPGVDTTAARESIIVRAMASTQHLTSDAAIALADNADNGFKPEQREFLRAYAAAKTARAEEAATKSTSQVNSEIVDGTNTDSQFKNMGIKQYRAKIADALKQGSTAIAEEVSAKFTNWANVHASKAEAAKKAIQGINGNRTIVRLKDEEGKSGLWQLAPKPSAQMSAEEKAQYAEVKVMNSPKLVGVISAEATSLLATSKELSLAVGIQKKNGKAAPVDPLAPAPTVQVPVAVVTPPPAATPPVVVPVAPTPSPTSSGKANPSEFTLMSGGAKGADTLWDSIGRTFGLTKAKHFWMGQTTPIGNTEISEDDTKEGKEKVTLAARAMGRIAPTHNVQSPLLIRNWSQVKYADAVFAVTTMLSAGSGMNYDKKALIRQGKGGTGYAIEMAIQAGKPVYVFDQERGRWFANLGKGWVNSDTPTLTKNFAGIGTREINAAGKQAIRDVFEKTFSGAPLNIAPAVVVPVAPVTPPPKPTAPVQSVVPPYYTGKITPDKNTVFVFGSNPEGRHGSGAALVAKNQFGAKYGQGEGLQGNAYALPTKDLRVTKDKGLRSIPGTQITESIKKLYVVAKQHPDKLFKIAFTNTTEASLNGYTGLEMIEMFNAAGVAPTNIIFSEEWFKTGKLLSTKVTPKQTAPKIGDTSTEVKGRFTITKTVVSDNTVLTVHTNNDTGEVTKSEYATTYPDIYSDELGDKYTLVIYRDSANPSVITDVKSFDPKDKKNSIVSYGKQGNQTDEKFITTSTEAMDVTLEYTNKFEKPLAPVVTPDPVSFTEEEAADIIAALTEGDMDSLPDIDVELGVDKARALIAHMLDALLNVKNEDGTPKFKLPAVSGYLFKGENSDHTSIFRAINGLLRGDENAYAKYQAEEAIANGRAQTPTTAQNEENQEDQSLDAQLRAEFAILVAKQKELEAASAATPIVISNPETASSTAATSTVATSQQEDADTVITDEGNVAETVTTKADGVKVATIENLNNEVDPETPAIRRNWATEFLYQVGAGVTTSKPLVMVSNFLTRMINAKNALSENTEAIAEMVAPFITEPLTSEQKTALATFFRATADWAKTIQDNFEAYKENANPDWTHTNKLDYLFKFTTDAEGKTVRELDESVIVAIAYAAYAHVADKGSEPRRATKDAINLLMGRDKNAPIRGQHWKILGDTMTFQHTLVDSLGARAIEALGLKADDKASTIIIAGLKIALGTQAMVLLENKGIIIRQEVSGEQFENLKKLGIPEDARKGKDTPVFEGKHIFLKFNRKLTKTEDGNRHVVAKAVSTILEANRGTGGIVDQVMQSAHNQQFPGTKANPKTPKIINISGQVTPGKLEVTVLRNQKRAWRIKKAILTELGNISEATVLHMMGVRDAESVHKHVLTRESIQAKNEGLKHEWELLVEFVDMLSQKKSKLDTDIFLTYDVWKQQRVGIKHSAVNPQTSKIVRQILTSPQWKTKVELANADQMNDVYLRIAESLDMKTERSTTENNMPVVMKKLTDPVIVAGVEAIKVLLTDSAVTTEQEQAIADAVEKGNHALFSYNGLKLLAEIQIAEAKGEATVRTDFTGEVDGVTSGTTLNHILYGAGYASSNMGESLIQGGFITQDSESNFYGDYRTDPASKDVYQGTAKLLHEGVQSLMRKAAEVGGPNNERKIAKLKAIWKITGFADTAGNIANASRNVIKDAVNPIAFGSAVQASVNGLANGFITKVVNGFEKISENAEKSGITAEEVQKQVDAYTGVLRKLTDNNNPKMFTEKTLREWLEYEFSEAEYAALNKAYTETVGKVATKVIETQFGDFLSKTKVMNKAAKSIYDVYEALASGMRKTYIDELVAKGDLLLQPETEASIKAAEAAVKAGKEPKDRRIVTLSKEQEAELQKRLAPFIPFLATSASNPDIKEEGLFVGKIERKSSPDPLMSNVTRFGNQISNRVTDVTTGKGQRVSSPIKSLTIRAIVGVVTDPGVSLISAGTHSLDSDISHTVQKDRHVLNAHDALIDGIGRLSGTARELNKAAFEAVLKYSPLTAMADTLHNLLEAINTAHENGEITAAQMKPIMAALTKNDGLAVVNELSVFAMNADLAKFEFLSLLKTVDHYANEKGAYQLTEEDRAKAVAAYDAAVAGGLHAQRRGTYTILNKLLNVVGSKVVIPGSKVARFSNSSTPKFSGRTRKTTYKTAQAPAPVAVTVAPEYTATVEQDTSNEIASLFEGRKFRSAKALAVEFKKLFKGKGVHTDYLVNLLGIIEKTMPDNLKIMYVTESTSDKHIHGKPDVPVHGWFARGGAIAAEKGSDVDGKKGMGLEGGIIYIMGKGMPGSKLSAELLVHEILHAVLEDAITLGKREIDAEGKLTAAGNLVNDLEQLLVETTAIVNSNPELKQKFGPAVKDIYELLSWGMTNQDFQASVLSQMRAEGNISPETIASLSYKMANAMNAFLMPIINYIRAITGVSIETSGVTRLLVIGSGLLYEAQNIKAAKSAIPGGAISRAMASSNPVTNLTTQEVFEAIDTQAISPAFSNKLVNLLDHIVHKLHGPFGVDYAIQQQGAASNPMDTLMKAMATGIAPFAASVAQGPFISSPQELYVMEQVEATMETALQSPAITTSMAYGELKRLYMEARQEMKTVMSPAEYDFIFGSTTTASREDYLARFVALTLGNEGVNTQMQFTTSKARKALRSDGTIGEKVQNFFLWALEKLTNTVTKATPGLKATTKMEILVSRLVDIDAKQKEALEKEGAVGAQAMKKVADAASEAIVTASSKLLQSRAVKGSKRSLIRMANTLTKVAADGNMELYLDGLQQLRDKVVQDRNGIVAATLGEFRGVKERFLMAMLTVKEQQQVRQKINNSVSESILGAFIDGGIGLTTQTRAAITRVGMRTGLSKLLKHYDIGQIQEMLSDVTVRTARINALTKELGKLGNIGNHFIEQANVTAYHSVTGIARNKMKLANAYAIASGVGTQAHGKLSNSEINSAEVLIEELITLLAIRYSSPTDVAAVSKVMTDEAARGDKNGMLFLLKLAKHYEEESLKHLFNGNKMQMIHGYTPEVVNTNTDVRFATEAEGKLLLLQGYKRVANTNVDFDDRNKEVTGVYTLRNSGKVTPYVSGLLALNSLESKGSSMTITESTSFEEQAKELKKVITTRANTVSIKNAPKQLRDLSSMSENFAVPTIDEKGNVVDFRYMMTSAHRDSILERDNDFSKLMGVHGSKIFDKTKTPAMNTQIVEMLKADYDDGRKLVPHSYILVGVNSPNPEMRAIWASLSSATKDSVKETWGVEGMYVRMDSLDIVFGYSKLSLGNQFNRDMNPRDVKNMRGQAKAMIIDASLNLVATYAKAQLGMNSDDAQEYAKRLSTWINRGELGWRELTTEIKDIIVVKSLVVSASNIMSNLTLLWLKGVPITAMARLHKEGLAGAIAYQEDSSKLLQLQAMLEAGYIETNLEDLKQEIALLEKSIEKNPVTPLVKAGLMPTIVEDLSANEDAYSYKASLSKALENKTSWVNPKIKAAARSVYMTHDTKGYQGLARAAQLSDFVARYVLYTHQTTKKEGKLEHLAAVRDASEAFVNYDMPMHRMTQYLDDMGIMPFMKYFLRIQGVLARATKDEPTRAMTLVALGHLIGAGSVVTGSSLFANFMDNPFRAGALNFPFMLDEMVTTSWIN